MLAALALAVLLPTNAPVSCDDVRRVRALVTSEGLDDASLRAIEAKYCAPAVVQPPARPPHGREVAWSRACIDLRVMSTLGHAGGAQPAHLEEIDGLMGVACGLGLSEGRITWKSGLTARSSSGAWSWPNGLTAKSSSGRWSWPNGLTAKSTSGAWSWPSGITARSSTGRWSRPNGTSAAREQVAADGCAKEPDACRMLARFASIDEDLATAHLLALAWRWR